MNPYTEPSRRLTAELHVGNHALTNHELRQVYGMSRVTTKARGEVAAELRKAGLQILSDPSSEPLFVRKLAPARGASAPPAPRPVRAWWRRPWAIAAGALVLLFVAVAALTTGPPASSSAGEQATLSGAAAEATTEPASEPTPAATEPPQTIADARSAVADDDYAGALLIAAALGRDDERTIERRIARRLAYRTMKALRSGDRSRASRLLREAREYPRTAEITRADAALDAAQTRAQERAAAKRRAAAVARAARRARAETRRQARAEARRRAAVTESAPSVSSAPEPSMSGPSTFNWCGKRDGDGDGIYCEGM